MPAGLIGGATAIGGALIGSSSSNRATEAIQEGSDAQIDLARDIYQDQRDLNQPFYETGVASNAASAELLGVSPATGAGGSVGGNAASPYGGQNTAGGYGFSQFGIPQNIARDFTDLFPQNAARASEFGFNGNNGSLQYGGGSYGSNSLGFGVGNGSSARPLARASEFGFNGNNGSLQYGGGSSARPLPQAQTPQISSNGSPIYQNSQLTAIQQSPGYQFRLQEGMNQLETGAAARGGLLSGQHIKAATQYGQDYASNEYNNRFNQLQALTSGGQAATNNIQNAGSNFGNTAGNALGQSANAQANGIQQRSSIYGGALGNIGGILAGGI